MAKKKTLNQEALEFVLCFSEIGEIQDGYIYASNDKAMVSHKIDIDINSKINIKSALEFIKKTDNIKAFIQLEDGIQLKDEKLKVMIGEEKTHDIFEICPITTQLPIEFTEGLKLLSGIKSKKTDEGTCENVFINGKVMVKTNKRSLIEFWLSEDIGIFTIPNEVVKSILKTKIDPEAYGMNNNHVSFAFPDATVSFEDANIKFDDSIYGRLINCEAYDKIVDLGEAFEALQKFEGDLINIDKNTVFCGKASYSLKENVKSMKLIKEELKIFSKHATHFNCDENLKFYGDNIRGVIVELKEV